EIHPFIDDVGRIRDRLAHIELADGHEAFEIAPDVHDHALVHEAGHRAAHIGAYGIRLTNAQPRIFGGLLEPQRDALVLGVDVEDYDIHGVALLDDLGRVLHALRPGHVRDVNESIDPRLDLDERTKGCEVADLAREARSHRILVRQHDPRILLRLLHSQRDFLLGGIHLEHDGLHHLANGHQLGWMPHVARPAHLADVHESFDARFELDERAVVRDGNDLAVHTCAHRILLGHILPRIALQLLQAE